MKKVILKGHGLSEYDMYTKKASNWYAMMSDMKNWCRQTFGKGYNTVNRKWGWRSGCTVVLEFDEFDEFEQEVHYPVFYFTEESHATLFLIRWS